MTEFRELGRESALEIRDFIHPIWHEAYDPILVGGAESAEKFFHRFTGKDAVLAAFDRGCRYWEIVVDGEVAGITAAEVTGDSLFISKLYILGKYRHTGLAQETLEFLFGIGRKSGCTSAYLKVNSENRMAKKAYAKAGFVYESSEQNVDDDGSYCLETHRRAL